VSWFVGSVVSVVSFAGSAGSDSDIMLDMIELVKPYEDCGEIRYTFFDTGLEYDATLRHITEVEQKYGVTFNPYQAVRLPSVSVILG